jgi:hypothetical protein
VLVTSNSHCCGLVVLAVVVKSVHSTYRLKLPSHVLFDKRDLELLQQEAETDSRAKFGKETVARAHRRPKWVLFNSVQTDSGRAQGTRLCSG